MNRNITGKRPTFHDKRSRSKPLRILLFIVLIVEGLWLINQIGQDPEDRIKPLFLPTPTATRTASSHILEAEAYFNAGVIDSPDPDSIDAIDAYRQALILEPDDAQTWAKLARLLTYSSSLLPTQAEQIDRMQEARFAIEKGVEANPDDSNVQAIYALVLDWSASVATDDNQKQAWLTEAERIAGKAINLDPNNALALAFYAEVLLDQLQWVQALEHAQQAVELAPQEMDPHRVYATILETFGEYRVAIEEYQKAAAITPNLTFLNIRIGVIYRELNLYDQALEAFDKAITINNSNDIEDTTPYIGIAKTYIRTGDFFIAALNAEKALIIDPANANTYGQLGIIYTKARNYESAMLVLECAVIGCTVERTNEIIEEILPGNVFNIDQSVTSLALTNLEVAYYYAQYGSVLAALSTPGENMCDEAIIVLDRVRETYPEDPSLLDIVEINESICLLLEETPEAD